MQSKERIKSTNQINTATTNKQYVILIKMLMFLHENTYYYNLLLIFFYKSLKCFFNIFVNK
jgi:hypothetical protein